MTPEELEEIVARGKPMKVAEALASLTEAERRKLSKFAAELYRRAYKAAWEPQSAGPRSFVIDPLRLLGAGKVAAEDVEQAAKIAVLGVCPLSVARKMEYCRRGAVVKVLADRRPEWLGEWLEHRLNGEWPTIEWEVVRGLVKAGGCSKPDCEGYYRLMAFTLPEHDWKREESRRLSSRLLSEPDLLEDVWRLFDVETVAFVYDYGSSEETWADAVVNLSRSGQLDRGRLLDAALRALSTGFKQNTLSGYMRVYEKLEPTVEETAARQEVFFDLLSNQAGHVVTFAVTQLKVLHKAGGLTWMAWLRPAGESSRCARSLSPRRSSRCCGG